jgi:hypothetical protein
MFLSVLIAARVVIFGIALTWIGIELTFRPPQNDAEKTRVRSALGASALMLAGLTIWVAKVPVNLIGIKALSTQLLDGGAKYRAKYGPR